MSNDQEIETMIKDKGADQAPRITAVDVENEIVDEVFVNPTGTLTICVLTLKNGFTVTGESACASPANFNAEIGQKIARGNAVTKIWGHLAFRLRDEIASGVRTQPN